jgi:hypothetical protein
MKLAILSANLNNFDTVKPPVDQTLPEGIERIDYHCYTDDDFPPITGLTPRLQYRIPKLYGWEMFPGYDYYIWLDGGCSLLRPDCVEYYLEQLGDADIAFFKHPTRSNLREEVAHIQEHLDLGKPYITSRYKNGLHQEFLDKILTEGYPDKTLYASTVFIYRNTDKVSNFLEEWWKLQSRYFTCDQVQLSYALWKHNMDVVTFDQPIYKTGFMSLVSKHR